VLPQVDKHNVFRFPINQVSGLILGPPGTSVALTFQRRPAGQGQPGVRVHTVLRRVDIQALALGPTAPMGMGSVGFELLHRPVAVDEQPVNWFAKSLSRHPDPARIMFSRDCPPDSPMPSSRGSPMPSSRGSQAGSMAEKKAAEEAERAWAWDPRVH
jgi:hypothetical protein